MNEHEQNTDDNQNEINGYSLFNEVEYSVLQAFNRCRTIQNIKEFHGEALARQYVDQLSSTSKMKVALMYGYIKKHGWDEMNRVVISECNKRESL